MKKLILTALTVLIVGVSFGAARPVSRVGMRTTPLREVTHMFTHALIADAELAFSQDNWMRSSYDADCVTVSEFKAILNSLYQRDFMLVDIDRVSSNGRKTTFEFPADKKPLILSFDDINYYVKKMNLGMNDKLVVRDGRIGAILNGQVQYDNEVVTVLENFIAAHPDFSYRGARGVLSLTGFNGILGYRTQSGSHNRAEEIEAVKPVVAELKARGWKFACHSYGHYHMKSVSAAKMASDTDKWLKEVSPLVGETNVYVYPYGEHEVTDGQGGVSERQQALLERGFSLFCGVGSNRYFELFPNAGDRVLLMDRQPLDGITLRGRKEALREYFDFEDVYDFGVRPK